MGGMEKSLDRKIIVVSNREPYSMRGGRLTRTVGGLVSALDPLMQKSRGVWIAAAGRTMVAAHGGRVMVPPGASRYAMRLVPIASADMDCYYNGYSNRVLWPLCHMTLDRVFHARAYWKSYVKVNRLIAGAVVDEGGPEAAVWLQDYHLALCAGEIKARNPGIFTTLFWHIPWPPHSVFRVCPQRKELLRGLLANDLLGFQLESFKADFMRCVEGELDAEVDMESSTVFMDGHTTSLKSFPISVDYGSFEKAAVSAEADRFIKRFLKAKKLGNVVIGLSVNRLDYTKGMIKCLEAIELFFAKYPQYIGKVTFVQIAVPTRKVEPYASYRERVRCRVASINQGLSSGSWKPVEYIETDLGHTELAALYRRAAFAIISSVYDGMNLVAKEYISSQADCNGVLLVSEFAGAAEDIPGVTVINPYDAEGCADEIKKAIEKDPGEKRRAMAKARSHIKEHDIFGWVKNISVEMDRIIDGRIPFKMPGQGKLAVK